MYPVVWVMRKPIFDCIHTGPGSESARLPPRPNSLPDFSQVIKQPMDLSKIRAKLEGGVYTYSHKDKIV